MSQILSEILQQIKTSKFCAPGKLKILFSRAIELSILWAT